MPGTVVEEGECVFEVKQVSGQSRYDQIIHMIEQSEQMKSDAESKAASLADRLVPYTFAGSILSLALTRNVSQGAVCVDGGFFVRAETGHAAGGPFCDAGGRKIQYYCQRG